MSNAVPMSSSRRRHNYDSPWRWNVTVRQARQLDRMAKRERLRGDGTLRHGASGMPVRKPLARSRASRGESR